METSKIEKIGAYLIISILILMMIFSSMSFILPKLVEKYDISFKGIDIEESTSKNINWKELYAFKEENEETSEQSIIDKYKQKINNITNKLEEATSEKLIQYEKFVELSYAYEKLINYSVVSNKDDISRVTLDEEYLTRLVPKYDVTESSERLITFNNYLDDLGIDFLYVQAPYKIPEDADSISNIYKDYSNSNMNNLINLIDGKVDYIDMKKVIKDNNLSHVSMFFKTDHHWLPKTGLWATNQVSRYLNNNYNMQLATENSNIENYTITTYNKMFLGADGKYVTLANTQPEDFDLLTPDFDTQLSVKILDENIDKRGTYLETLINEEKIKYDNYYNVDQYSAYSYGTKPLIEIHNELVNNDKKILLVRDSFGNVVIPFLALETEYLSAIDLRYFTGSLKTYIEEYQPDIVVVMYTGSHYAEFKETTNALWEFE